jgi:hypothetical protein
MSTPEAPIRMSTGWPGERSMCHTLLRERVPGAVAFREAARSAMT